MSLRITTPNTVPAVVLDQLFLKHFVLTQETPDGAKTVDMKVAEYGIDPNGLVVWGKDYEIHTNDFDTWMVANLAPIYGGVEQVMTAYAADKLAAQSDTLLQAIAGFQTGIGHICTLNGVVGAVTVE